jgi:peptide-methionine (S)-S-oxide reductase
MTFSDRLKRIFTLLATAACLQLVVSPVIAQPAAAKTAPGGEVATAIFAGGCFWCTEKDFEELPGVIAAESGYTAGKTENPTYESVSAGYSGHTEAVRVTYDPKKVSYPQLVEFFWKTIDPGVRDRQFCDIGSQYRSGIYWQNEAERLAATASRDALLKTGRFKNIYTELAAASKFWPAEEYHQDYYKKNSLRYKVYRRSCGRDARLADIWSEKK